MSVLRSERQGSTVLWTVDRVAARNAIDEEVRDLFEHAVAEAESDKSVRAVVLTGAGGAAFISGADLKFLRDATPERRAQQDTRMNALLTRMAKLPVPVIAALNGVVMGGGAEVALACDIRIAEPDASFTFKQAALGLTPGWGGLSRLACVVGRGTASKLLFGAQAITPQDALRVGLVDELVPTGGAQARALELAKAIGASSPSAIADMKRLLARVYQGDADSLYEDEKRTFSARTTAGDHVEALEAVFERRAPTFGDRE